MTEILLATDDLTIFGGPSKLNVEVDFGPPGERGSQIFVGFGNPNDVAIGQDPKIFDLYINILAGDPTGDYLSLYQYQQGISGDPAWIKLFKLIPNTYSTNREEEFVDGEVLVNVLLTDVVPAALTGELTEDNFNIQFNIKNDNPISSAISVGAPQIVEGSVILPVTVKAVEYDGLEWSQLSGSKTVQLLITVV
jgi:hypothetical protein